MRVLFDYRYCLGDKLTGFFSKTNSERRFMTNALVTWFRFFRSICSRGGWRWIRGVNCRRRHFRWIQFWCQRWIRHCYRRCRHPERSWLQADGYQLEIHLPWYSTPKQIHSDENIAFSKKICNTFGGMVSSDKDGLSDKWWKGLSVVIDFDPRIFYFYSY